MIAIAATALVWLGCVAVDPARDDWPQWRGPRRDGRWREEGLTRELPDRITLLWSAPVGSGYSGPTVSAGRVYVSDRSPDGEGERVHAFDQATGTPLWTRAWAADYAELSYGSGPRVAVQVHAGRAIALGAVGHLAVFDARTGEPLWDRDLLTAYGGELPMWGFSAAPIVEGELLIVPAWGKQGAALVALDLETGKEAWRALPDRANYSSPIVVDQAGRRVVVLWTADRVVGVAAKSGALLWEYDLPPKSLPHAVATPVVAGDRLFLTAFYDGCALLELAADTPRVSELWRRRGPNERTTDGLHSTMATPIIRGDHVYGVDSYGELRCLALSDGSRVWEQTGVVKRARWANFHMVENGDDVWILNEQGELILARLSPDGYEEVDRGRLLDPTAGQVRGKGVVWSHPAFAGRQVFARNDEIIVCASLAAS